MRTRIPCKKTPIGPRTTLPLLNSSQKKLSIFQIINPRTKVAIPFRRVFNTLSVLSGFAWGVEANRRIKMKFCVTPDKSIKPNAN